MGPTTGDPRAAVEWSRGVRRVRRARATLNASPAVRAYLDERIGAMRADAHRRATNVLLYGSEDPPPPDSFIRSRHHPRLAVDLGGSASG